MKKCLIIGLLVILLTLASNAQKLYSQQNLDQTSEDVLFHYLTKAQKLERTGGFLLIAVPASAISGLVLTSVSHSGGTEGTWRLGLYMIMGSLGFTAAGIPAFLIGSSRVKKVTTTLSSKYKTALIDLAPCSLYNYQTQNVQPGITFRIRF